MNQRRINQLTGVFYVFCRISIGVFFFITGFNKLFHPVFKGYMLSTISGLGFSNPQVMADFVAANEMVWGLFLLFGLFTRISALSLIIIMLVALFSKDIHSIPKELIPIDQTAKIYPMDNFTWLTYFYYLPQVLYIMLLGLFSLNGYKALGIDKFIARKNKRLLY